MVLIFFNHHKNYLNVIDVGDQRCAHHRCSCQRFSPDIARGNIISLSSTDEFIFDHEEHRHSTHKTEETLVMPGMLERYSV